MSNKFELSQFQKDAIQSIKDGNHTLITAHTGSGKTLPAEFAIEYFTGLKKKVIYTSPIKALSNQKYNDFTKKYPLLDIGILTGDNKHNPNANVLIMTTEILQNNLFRSKMKNSDANSNSNANSNANVLSRSRSELDFDMDMDNDLACVIFDEVHYIDDPERGTVWEQSMILLPNHVQFVMLSATIGEKEKFAGWIERIKEKKVVICSTEERVVPLIFYSFFTAHPKAFEGHTQENKLFLESKHNKLDIVKEIAYHDYIFSQNKKCLAMVKDKNIHRNYVINELCKVLRQKEMFPALFFVFSRKKVEDIAHEITFPLFEENEKDYEIEHVCKQLIVSRVVNWKEYIMLPEYSTYIKLLNKGIGIHHAGMLPIFREMIEILYEKRYIKVLIATETFAIGLNMPTKTVCFTSLYKHDGKLRKLHPHEFIQMSGRAGRRNIDTVGHVILLSNLYDPYELHQYYTLLNSSPKILKSKFKIGYDLILQMSNKTIEEVKCFSEKSMMNEDILRDIDCSTGYMIQLREELELNQKEMKYIDVCERYVQLKDDVSISKNKMKRQLLNEIFVIESTNPELKYYLNKFKRMNEIEKEMFQQKEYILYCTTYIETHIGAINTILKDNLFIKDNVLTEKGKFASCIHEIHPLVFTDLYFKYNGFMNLSSTEIFCLLSCFYPMKEGDTIIPPMLKPVLLYTKERLNYYNDQDDKHEITNNTYIVQYNLMEYIREWMDDCDNEIKSVILLQKIKSTLFCGDFVKCCLKIVNISKEMELYSTYELKEKLIEGKAKLMKFICTNQSLYL